MDIITTRRTKVEKGYELLADITVGTATTSVDITGLNIGKGDEIVLVSDIKNTSVSTSIYYLYFNATTSGYYSQGLSASATTYPAARTTDARMLDIATNQNASLVSSIRLTNSGYVISQNNSVENYGSSSVLLNNFYATTTFTATSVTEVRVTGSVVNSIGIGSRFQLYKIGGA